MLTIFVGLDVIGIVKARVGNMLIKNKNGLVVESNQTARWAA
jgi:hypothetical protein